MKRVAVGLCAVAIVSCSEQTGAQPATSDATVQQASLGDAAAGKAVFQGQCLLCHSAESGDGGGAQGPTLGGIVGRPAAAHPQFGYTAALRNSGLSWDAATLDRFLAAPTQVVPGSSMVIPVAAEADRANVIAYLATTSVFEPAMSAALSTVASGGDWRNDRPGQVHRIDPDNLPAPSEPGRAFPQLVERPAEAELHVPEGFAVEVFSTALSGPRRMEQAPNGDIFVAENRDGRIKILRQGADGAAAGEPETWAEGLNLPFGLAFYPDTDNPEWLYVAEGDRVVRFAYAPGQPAGEPEVVVPTLPAEGHFTRDIAFAPDGSRFFVSVGSASNVGENLPTKTPEEALEWDQATALGAPWGPEEHRAMVLAYETDGDGTPTIFATGLRNCVRTTIQPDTGELWCTVNERDQLGDDLVPDYSTRVREGGFYGWPWYYFGSNEDPRRVGERPDLAGKATVPDVPFQAHSAALDLVFYEANDGASAFPAEYVGDGFAVFHGSWNRSSRTGHKVVRVLIESGVPTGEYEDFLTGFVTDEGAAWGRPAALVALQDGSLLLSDDGANVVYRISHAN